MEVHFDPTLQEKLTRAATEQGRDSESLVVEAVERMLNDDARFVEAVKLGEAQLERGEYLTHEQVGERIERLFKP